MKVLHTIASVHANYGGPARSVPQLVNQLVREGGTPAIWVAAPGPIEIPELEKIDFPVFQGDLDPVLRDFRPDIIHEHGLWLPSDHKVATLSHRLGIPRIVSPRGMLMPRALRSKYWKKRIAWLLYQQRDLKRAQAFHATAIPESDGIRALGFNQPIYIVPNGVQAPDGLLRQVEPLAARKRKLVFVGRVHPLKGLRLLVEAWGILRPRGWEVRILGPCDKAHKRELKQLLEYSGQEQEWVFEGEKIGVEKWQALLAADLFVLPSYTENFGISVAEALSVGVPVITTTGTPWSGILEHQCGWYVEPTAQALRLALAEALSLSDGVRLAMGERGRQWCVKDFSWKGIASKILAGYEEILSMKRLQK